MKGLFCILAGLLVVTVPSVAETTLAVVPSSHLKNEADLISAALSTQVPEVAQLERASLESIVEERELDAAALKARLHGAAAILLLEDVTAGPAAWKVARLVDTRTSAVLGLEAVPADDESANTDWPNRVAAMVHRQLGKLTLDRARLQPLSIINFRPAFQAGQIANLTTQSHLGRLLADRLAAQPQLVVLDRTSLLQLRFEKELHPVNTAWWNTGWTVDGTFKTEASGMSAHLRLQKGQSTPVELEVPAAASAPDLIEKAATAIAEQLQLPVPAMTDAGEEAQAYALEADWLWRIGLREEAVPPAWAAIELGSRDRKALAIPVLTSWFRAWPNLYSARLGREEIPGVEVSYRNLEGVPQQEAALIFPDTSSSNFVHPDADDLRPSTAQLNALADGIDGQINLDRYFKVTRSRDSRTTTVHHLWLGTAALAACTLDLEYAYAPGDEAHELALRRVRDRLRRALTLLKTDHPDLLVRVPPLAAIIAESMTESAAAWEAGGAGVMELAKWVGRSTHHEHWHRFKDLAEWVQRPLVYDWTRRDRAAAASLEAGMLDRWIASEGDAAAKGLLFRMLRNQDDTAMQAAAVKLARHLALPSVSPWVRGQAANAVGNLSVSRQWMTTERFNEDLAHAWIDICRAAANSGAPDMIYLLSQGGQMWKGRPDRNRWAQPMFEIAKATVAGINSAFDEDHELARLVSYSLDLSGIKAEVQGKVVTLKHLWPETEKQMERPQARFYAADLDATHAYVIPVWHGDDVPQEIRLYSLRLPDLKLDKTWLLPWKTNTQTTNLSLRVRDGIAHIGIGAMVMSLDLKSGTAVEQYASPELTRMRSQWFEGKWYGFTYQRAKTGGLVLAEVDAAAKQHRMLADTVRNPPLHRYDKDLQWGHAWPLVPIGPNRLLAYFEKSSAVFNLQTGLPEEWLAPGSSDIGSKGSGFGYQQLAQADSVFVVAGMTLNQTARRHRWKAVAFDSRSGAHQVLLWEGTRPFLPLSKPVAQQPIFDQPPDPDYRTAGQICGPIGYDGQHLVAFSRFCDLELRARLHVWQRGDRRCLTYHLDLPPCRVLNLPGVENDHPGLKLIGDPPVGGTFGKFSCNNVWCSQTGILLCAMGRGSYLEGLFFIPWSELE